MKELITKVDKYNNLTNAFTREMDSYLIPKLKELKEKNGYGATYFYEYPFGNKWLFRYPGATRGNVEVDDNMIIKKITLYDDEYHTDDIYEPNVRRCFEKYIGMKLVIE